MGAGLVMLAVAGGMWWLMYLLGRDYGLPHDEKVLRRQLREIRWRRIFWMLVVFLAPALSGCATSAIDNYDACMASGGSFQAIAACGKARRMASCTSIGNCSAVGNAIMQYADALAAQVSSGEITDAEAKRRFVEFKAAQANAVRQAQATAAASIPVVVPDSSPRGPVMCTAVGSRSAICN